MPPRTVCHSGKCHYLGKFNPSGATKNYSEIIELILQGSWERAAQKNGGGNLRGIDEVGK